jgi:4-diphosphocytidyl-2-C-methyl-D-erythritol kinase
MIFSLAVPAIFGACAVMKVRAPAKVNLQLRILGRRADGFHDIETVIVPVSLSDEITLEIFSGETVSMSCDDPTLPTDRRNLAAEAVYAFQGQTGLRFGAKIDLCKHIPVAAGLGGGSSDAAAVLFALDQLLATQIGFEGLEKIAARLGSDVPCFVRRRPAICRGRGEIIEPFELPEKLEILLIKPPFGVETAWAYNAWATSQPLPKGLEVEQDLGWIKIFNALERPVFEKFIVLPVLKNWLLRQAEVRAAGMSGSGSSFFAVLRDGASGSTLEARLKAMFGDSFWTALCGTQAVGPPIQT